MTLFHFTKWRKLCSLKYIILRSTIIFQNKQSIYFRMYLPSDSMLMTWWMGKWYIVIKCDQTNIIIFKPCVCKIINLSNFARLLTLSHVRVRANVDESSIVPKLVDKSYWQSSIIWRHQYNMKNAITQSLLWKSVMSMSYSISKRATNSTGITIFLFYFITLQLSWQHSLIKPCRVCTGIALT